MEDNSPFKGAITELASKGVIAAGTLIEYTQTSTPSRDTADLECSAQYSDLMRMIKQPEPQDDVPTTPGDVVIPVSPGTRSTDASADAKKPWGKLIAITLAALALLACGLYFALCRKRRAVELPVLAVNSKNCYWNSKR